MDPALPPVAGEQWLRGEMRVRAHSLDPADPPVLTVRTAAGTSHRRLDFQPVVEPAANAQELPLYRFPDVVLPVEIAESGEEPQLALEGEDILAWEFRHGALLAAENLPRGKVLKARQDRERGQPVVDLVFDRSIREVPEADLFTWKRREAEAGPIHLSVRQMDSRRLRLRPVVGIELPGEFDLLFSGGGEGLYGRELAPFRTSLTVPADEAAEPPGADPADLGSGGLITLTLAESPTGSGRLSAFTSGTFSETGRDARKTFEVELESGDQLSAYIDLIEPGADYRLRVEDANGTEVTGGYWGTDHPLQRVLIDEAGTYRVQAWVDHQTTDFDLRIDVGRNLYLEAENNDSQGASNRLLFSPASGGFQEDAAGALSALEPNDGWSGSNDVNGDLYDLGILSTGNTLDVTYQLPADTSLAPGDLELAVFAEGEETPLATSVAATGLSTSAPADGRYFLRVAANDNLDGTSLAFSGGTDRADIPAAVMDGLNDFTIEFWARGQTDGRALLSAANGSEANEFLAYFLNETTFRIHDKGPYFDWTVPRMDTITWRHFAIVRDGSAGTIELFVDGASMGQKSGQSSALSVTDLLFGQDQDSAGGGFDSNQAFIGNLEALRVWNALRTPSEIADNRKTVLAGNETGLQAAYRFNEGSGLTTADATANAFDISLVGVVFDGDVNAAGFNPAKLGLDATYYGTVTVIDSVAPEILATTLPSGTGDGYFTEITLTISEDLDPETVALASAYDLRAAGPDGEFDTGDDEVYAIEPRSYSHGAEVALFLPDGPLQPGEYRFQASSALEDRAGNALVAYNSTFTLEQLGDFIIENRDNGSRAKATPLGEVTDPAHDGSFTRASSLPAENLHWLASADFNGDGLPDAVGIDYGSEELELYLNNGDGTFASGPRYDLFDDARDAVLVDLDGDGDLDVAVAVRDDDEVRVFLNLSDGTLAAGPVVAVGDGPRGIAAGDFDGDGDRDLMTSNDYSSDLTLLLNEDGSGGAFSTRTLSPAGADPHRLVVGLFDADAVPDVVFSDNGGRRVGFLSGNGDGTFSDPVYSTVDAVEEERPIDVESADFDGDGLADLVVAHNDSWQTERGRLLYGNGDGTFVAGNRFYTDSNRTELHLADYNADGTPDLVAANRYAVRVYAGTGDRDQPFASRIDYNALDDAYGLVLADFNGDGRIDFLTGEPNDDLLYLYAGNPVRRPLADATKPGFYQALGRGNLSDEDDVDWYRFSAEKAETLQLVAWNVDQGDGRAGLSYELYDAGGNRRVNRSSSYTGGRLQMEPFVASASGTYFLRVDRSYPYLKEHRFRISILPPGFDAENENNDRTRDANNVTFGTSGGVRSAGVYAQFMPGDDSGDFFSLGNLAAGTEVDLAYSNTEDSSASPKLWLYEYDGSSDTIIAETAQGTASLSHTVAADGTYYARVTTLSEDLGFFSEYRLLIELTDAEPPSVTGDSLPAEGSTTSDLLIAFSLQFNEDLLATSVNDPANYELRGAGADGLFGTADDFTVAIGGLDYSGGLSHTYLLSENPLQPGKYRFTAFAGGLADRFGNPLPDDYVRAFTVAGLPDYLSEGTDNDTFLTADPLTEDPPGPASGSFTFLQRTLLADEYAEDLLLFDADGDGFEDALVTFSRDDTFRVFAGDGNGGFTQAQSYPLGDDVYFMTSADTDGDGDADVAMAERGSPGGLRIFRNNGDGTFTDDGLVASNGVNPFGIAAADLDGLHGVDFVITHRGTSTSNSSFSLFLQQGDGSFVHSTILNGTASRPGGLVLRDLDGDDEADLAFADEANARIGVATGNGDGTFASPAFLTADHDDGRGLVAADFDDDGDPDLVAGHDFHDRVSVYYNNGDGTFADYLAVYMDTNRNGHLDAHDLDGDGRADLARSGDYGLMWRLQESSFGPLAHVDEGEDFRGLAVADVNEDGIRDLVGVSRNNGNLSVFRGDARFDLAQSPDFAELREVFARGRDVLGENNPDYYAFSAEKGQKLLIDVENDDPAWASHSFELYDSTGERIASDTLYNGYEQFGPYTLPRDGNYYFRAIGNNGHDDIYRFRLSLVAETTQPESENNNSDNNADAITFAEAPGSRTARIFASAPAGEDDSDWFKLGNLAENATVTLTFSQPDDSNLVPELSLRADNGNVTRISGAPGETEISYTLAAGEEDFHYAVVSCGNRQFFGRYFLDITIADNEPPAITGLDLPAEGAVESTFYVQTQLQFSEDLDPATVNDAGSYELRGAGEDGTFATGDDLVYSLAPQTYESGLSVVLAIEEAPLPPDRYRFTIAAENLRDLFGNSLAEDFVRTFRIEGLTGYVSESPFLDTFTNPNLLSENPNDVHDKSFTFTGTTYATFDQPRDLVTLDVDSDGDPDALVASGSNELHLDLYRNNGDGSFAPPESIRSAGYPDRIDDLATADFDGDGRDDVAMAVRTLNGSADSRVEVLLGQASGSFADWYAETAAAQPKRLAVGDLDGDGRPDLVAVEDTNFPRELSLFINNGDGTGFTHATVGGLPVDAVPADLALADFNADGAPDLVLADEGNEELVLLRNDGAGLFTLEGTLPVGADNPQLVAAADLNDDGLPEIIVGFAGHGRLEMMAGTGPFTFEAAPDLILPDYEYHEELLIADFDGDALPDVGVGVSRRLGFVLFHGQRGAGHFLSGAQGYEGQRTYGLGLGDFNTDGRVDLLIADHSADHLKLFTGNGGLPLQVDETVVGLRTGMGRGTLRQIPSADTDYWAFSGRAGDRLLITTENTGSDYNTEHDVSIQTAGGHELQRFHPRPYGGVGQNGPMILPSSGRLVLEWWNNLSRGGEYRLNVNLVPGPAQIESENNDNAGEADRPDYSGDPGEQEAIVFGAVDREDNNGDHFFLGNLDGGTSIQLRLLLPDNSLLEPRLRIYREDGTILNETTTSLPAVEATVPAGEGGAHYVRIDATPATRGFLATYHATLRTLDTAPPEIVGTDLPKSPSPDFFRTIELELNEDFDPASVNDQAAFTLLRAGPDGIFDTGDDVTVPLGDPGYSGGAVIDLPLVGHPLPPGFYRLTASTSLQDNYGNALPEAFAETFTISEVEGFLTEELGSDEPATATELFLEPYLSGERSRGGRGWLTNGDDVDYWKFSATAGERLVFATDFPGSPNFSALQFRLLAPDGSTVVYDEDSDRDGDYRTSGVLPLTQTGDYLLRVDFGRDSYTGPYRFRVTVLDNGTEWTEEPNDGTDTARGMTLSAAAAGQQGAINGIIADATDRDYISLGTIGPGNTLFLSAEPSPVGPLVPVVSVYRVATTGDDVFIPEVPSGRNGDGVVEIDITEEHEYFALVRGSSATGGLMSGFRLTAEVLPTDLADFANLQVTEVNAPSAADLLSGDTVDFSFTIQNNGEEATTVGGWIDRVIISGNNLFGDGDDLPLAVLNRESDLAAGDSYTVNATADLPEGISGSYFLIVRTDTGDQVDEFLFEGDNELASDGTFNVGLADYPDIVVENLQIPEPSVSGDLTVTWNTVNRGSDATNAAFDERVEVIDRLTGGVVQGRTDTIPAPLAVDGSVSRSIALTGLPASNYRVRITTDSGGDLYEYGASGHEAAEQNTVAGDFIVYRFFTVSTASSPAEGGTTTGGGVVREGTSVTVEATPDTSTKPYTFVRWKSAAGALLTTDPVYNFLPDANIDLIAEFELPLFTVTTSRSPEAGGTVSSGGGFRWGSTIVLSAVPRPGYNFDRWEDLDSAITLGTERNLPLTVETDRNLRAFFEEANPTHDVTVSTAPAGVTPTSGDGTYNNGETLDLSVPGTVVDLPREYTFQEWKLNGSPFAGTADTSKTFSTVDPPVMDFVAHYAERSYLPEVVSLTRLVATDEPVPAGALFGVTLRFDRAMDTGTEPELELLSDDADVVPALSDDGRWLDEQTWESGTVVFVSENSGSYRLKVSLATGTDGRTMDPAEVLAFSVDATPPDLPELTLLSTGDGTATVEWSGYPAPADLYTFRLYRSTSPFATVAPADAIAGIPAEARQYTFTGLDLDTDYHVAVVPVDTAGNAVDTVTPLELRVESDLPPAVSASLLADDPDRALLDWSGYDTSGLVGFDHFLVFREESDFSTTDGLSPVAQLPADARSYRSEPLDRTKDYFFAVVGVNRLGNHPNAVSPVRWTDPLAGTITEDLVFGGEGQERIEVFGSLTIANGATLTIEPGTTLAFAPGTGLTVADGRLMASGTALAPIRFTSTLANTEPPSASAGDWMGIKLDDATTPSVLAHVWIQYGSGLEVSGADPEANALALVDNAGAGLEITDGAGFTGTELFLGYNELGAKAGGSGSTAVLNKAVFRNNVGLQAEAVDGASIDAREAFWGSTDPAVIGAGVSGPVDTGDFLAAEPLLGLGIGLDQPTLKTTDGTVPVLLASINAAAFRISEDSTFAGVPYTELHPPAATRFLNPFPIAEDFLLSAGAGTKTLHGEFLNAAGDAVGEVSLEVELLGEGPQITGFNLAEGDVLTRPLQVDASASSPIGIAELRLELEGTTVLTSNAAVLTQRWDISDKTSGIYRLRLVAEDEGGNLATRSLNVTIDPQPSPAPVITSPADGTLLVVDTVDLAGTAEPFIPLQLTVNGTAVAQAEADSSGDFLFTEVPLLEGTNNVVVTAADAAGSTPSAPVQITSDTASPVALIMEEPVYDPETGLLLQWRFPEADGERPVRYKVFYDADPFTDPGEAGGSSPTVDVQSWAFEDQPNREYHFRVVGYDAAGNASAPSNAVTVRFDDTAPVMEVFYDKAMPMGSGDVEITLTSDEPLSATPTMTIQPEGRRLPISVPLSASGPETWTATFTVSDASMASGTAEVLVTARDRDRNRFSGSPGGEAFLVDLTRPTAVLRTNVEPPVQVLNPRQIELTLEISEPVKVGTVPSLTWSPPSGPDVTVDLEGAEAVWTGTLTLFPEMGKGDGLFLFEAFDAVDNKGTLLTRGDAFEIYNTLLPDPPSAPVELLAAARSGGRIELVWQPSERAETYNVYRIPSEQNGTPNQLVKEGIMDNRYVDTPPADGTYRYVVTASRRGAESGPSPSFTVTADGTPPPPPENIAVSLGTNGVRITFDGPSGGETPAGYVLYRNGSELPKTLPGVAVFRDFPPRGVMEYQVASSDNIGNHALSGTASIEMFLGPVKDVEVLVEEGEPVRLTWAQTDAITEGYNLYRNGVRQNPEILSMPAYADPLDPGGNPVTYAITAVNDQGQESAPREITVQPMEVSVLLNPDESGEEFNSIAGTFDHYRLLADNSSGNAGVDVDGFQFTRETSEGVVLERSFDRDLAVPPGAGDALSFVVASPMDEGVLQDLQLVVKTAPGPGGGIVRYKYTRELFAAVPRQPLFQLTAKEQPLAGGLTDFTVSLTNRGRTEMDFVLLTESGSQPGEFQIEVVDGEDQVVAVNTLDSFLSGLSYNADGDGYLRLAPGETESFPFPDVFVPEALADSGEATFVGRLGNLYYDVGGDGEADTGPFANAMESTLTETPYYGTSDTARGIYSNDEPIVITGRSLDRETSDPVAEKELRLGFEIQGYVFYREVTTDSEGNYSYEYTPTAGIGGQIRIWAAHPDVVDQLDQTTVVLYRSFLAPSRGDIRMSKNDYLDFEIQLINVGDRDLTDFTLSSRAYTVDDEGNETETDTVSGELREPLPATVQGRDRVPVKLRLNAELDAPDSLMLELTLTSSEGAASTFTGVLTLLPAIPVLDVVSPQNGYVDLTGNRGEIKSQQVTVTNRGLRPLEDVVLTPPENLSWMQVNLPVNEEGDIVLPDLPVGETLTFGVAYTPPEDTEIGFHDDFLLISGSNAVADFRINLFAQVGSAETGDVEFFVDNNLVQPIPNASIRIRNSALGIERGPTRTDANGYAVFEDLQEGRWSWKVFAPSHQGKAGTVRVEPDRTEGVDVRLGKSLVSVEFSVVPVPFTDRYEIKLEQTFETRVPAPVMVMDPPRYEFETSEPFELDVVFELTNHGLISVFDVEIEGSSDPYLRMTPLIEYLPELGAQETVEIPAKIVFSGFDQTLAEAGLGASPALVGGKLPSACEGPVSDAEVLQGILAIAKMGAKGGYECSDGDLGTAAAVALAAASAFEAAKNIGGGVAETLIGAVASIFGNCFSIDTGTGDGGSGSGPGGSHSSGPAGDFSGPGCFVAGTAVLLPDGSTAPIERLRRGDRVLTGSKGATARIEKAYSLRADQLLELRFENGRSLVTTPEHHLWVDGAGWTPAAGLRRGDWMQTSKDAFTRIASIESRAGPARVYTFQLRDDNAFFANGVLVQDLCGGQHLSTAQWRALQPLSRKEGGRP